MKALVLNLPHPERIYRCYRCSINSTGFCLPPLELLYQAAVLREAGAETRFLDATAERLSLDETIRQTREFRPDLVVSIMGYEHFTEDVDCVNAIRERGEVGCYALMGYLPSHLWQDTMRHARADLILRIEPEQTLRDVAATIQRGGSFEGIPGLVWRDANGTPVAGPDRPRMAAAELEALPLPARDLLKIDLYQEPFLGRPFTTFQAGRGCPYRCVYCTSTYGSRYVVRSPQHVVAEIESVRRSHGVRHFRLTDDTFAISADWTKEFCERLIATGGRYKWVALTRVDLMDRERMRLLRSAGCRRLFVGIESGSQRVLDYYRKRHQASQVVEMVANARRESIEVVGYLVVGSPMETEEDFQKTVELADQLHLDMACVYPMMPYPATDSHANVGAEVDFTLYPYNVRYRDPRIWEEANHRARFLMRRIYFSPRFACAKVKWVIQYPAYSLRAILEFLRWRLTGFTGRKRKSLL